MRALVLVASAATRQEDGRPAIGKLIRSSWFRWALALALLTALGLGIYELIDPAPMCEIAPGLGVPVAFDGDRMITLPLSRVPRLPLFDPNAPPPVKLEESNGALEVWDTRTGKRLASHFDADTTFWGGPTIASDRRWFVAETGAFVADRKINFLDLTHGSRLEVPVISSLHGQLQLTPNGEFVVRQAGPLDGRILQIFDCATGKKTADLATLDLVSPSGITDDLILHVNPVKKGKPVEAINPRDGKVIVTLPENDGHPSVSADGQHVIFDRYNAETRDWTVEVWHARTAKLMASYQQEDALMRKHRFFSADNRWMATVYVSFDQILRTDVRAFPSCRPAAEGIDTPAQAFSPDGRILAIDGHGKVQFLDVPSLKLRCTAHEAWPVEPIFSGDSQTAFLMANGRPELLCYAAATGKLRRTYTFRIPDASTSTAMTPDRSSLLVRRSGGARTYPEWFKWIPPLMRTLEKRANDTVLVIDTETCRPRFQLTSAGASSAWLSDDGNIVVTNHHEDFPANPTHVLRCWDVNAWKPLYWPIGVPAGLGALCVLWTWWRRKRSAKLASNPPPATTYNVTVEPSKSPSA